MTKDLLFVKRNPTLTQLERPSWSIVVSHTRSNKQFQRNWIIDHHLRNLSSCSRMDRAATSSRGDFCTVDPQSISSPDPEARGRKRRRDPLNIFSLPRHKPSGESSTLRGRCRHRSASRMHLVSTSTTAAHTTSQRMDRDSPELLSPASENHRRNRSPSRSRSPAASQLEAEAVPAVTGSRRRQGRRQRTQSRGRRQGLKGPLTSVVQTGRPSLGFEGWADEDGALEKD